MNFLSPSESVEKPCGDILSYPLQCFQDLFLATPAVVGTFFVSIGGFATAVLIWGAIFLLALYSIFFVLKHFFRAAKYFFHQTRFGQKVVSIVPFRGYMQRFCCRAQEVSVQPKKLINTQAIADYGGNIVSKVHVDSKWFKGALRHIPLLKSGDSSDNQASTSSPSKTPQRSTSRISALTPKLLSPKSHKQ